VRRIRVIPVLQIENRKLVKTSRFSSPAYVGDPMNALKIFNEKEADEICVIDIGASRNKTIPDLDFIKKLASECFMPLSYGGGITTLEQVKEILHAGVEKVIIGSAAFYKPDLISSISKYYGVQSVVVSIDYKKDFLNRYRVYINSGKVKTDYDPPKYAQFCEENGAGELLLQNIDYEGSQKGYDLDTIQKVSHGVSIPVVSLGGAEKLEDFAKAISHGASAVAAGDMFVYKGPHKAVLINYPLQSELIEKLYSKV
jgi:imidazole glycerol-phosphate synthase subunit HisF